MNGIETFTVLESTIILGFVVMAFIAVLIYRDSKAAKKLKERR